jgi:SAM-dependent methyltransferase
MCAKWNQLFRDPVNILRDPDPLVNAFLDAVEPGGRVFDFGCGGGRHVVHLASSGLKVTGGDVALSGLQAAREWLKGDKLNANLCLLEMSKLPFSEGVFDGAVSINVLQHATLKQAARAIEDIRGILKPGSPFYFVVIGREDARCGEGEEIEPFTFIHRKGTEAGVPHHYFDLAEIEDLVERFNQSEIEKRQRLYDDQDPIFGRDPRLKDRSDAILQHWAVRARV